MGRFSCRGVVLCVAAFLALAQASRGQGDSPKTALAAAKQILAKTAELNDASRTRAERIVAALEASPEVRVLTFPVAARAGVFSADGRQAAILGDRRCYLVDVEEARVLKTFDDEDDLIGSAAPPMAFSHDGRLVAIGLPGGEVAVWDTNTNRIANEDRLARAPDALNPHRPLQLHRPSLHRPAVDSRQAFGRCG